MTLTSIIRQTIKFRAELFLLVDGSVFLFGNPAKIQVSQIFYFQSLNRHRAPIQMLNSKGSPLTPGFFNALTQNMESPNMYCSMRPVNIQVFKNRV